MSYFLWMEHIYNVWPSAFSTNYIHLLILQAVMHLMLYSTSFYIYFMMCFHFTFYFLFLIIFIEKIKIGPLD